MKFISRRLFLKKIATFTLATLLAFGKLGAQSSPQPNLVIFVADDLGWGDVGYHGSEIQTPNIDRLVAEGVELDRFYAWPTCTPTRAGLLTGRSPIRSGITGPLSMNANGPPLDEPFLPLTLQNVGYQTWLCGKWHLGGTRDESYLPNARGFDHFYGFVGGLLDYYDHTTPENGVLDWQRNGDSVEEEGYTTYLLADEAVKLIKARNKTRPFMLYLPFNAPHDPLEAPAELIEKYSAIPNENRRLFAAVVDAMDSSIGQVLSTIESEGLKDSTLVMFFSDNGAAIKAKGGRNTPLQGSKGTVYEGGIRTPAVLRWPGVIPAVSKSEQVVSVMDLYPTFLSALVVDATIQKPFDGKDLWLQIQGDGENLSPEKIVFMTDTDPSQAAVLHDEWKLIQIEEANQLYKIFEDPTESNDVSNNFPEVVSELSGYIKEMKDLLTTVEIGTTKPNEFTLKQNYPNPFNPTTNIQYALSGSASVRLLIYDIAGRKVRELINERQPEGHFHVTWDARDFSGNTVSSGMYFYRIEIVSHSKSFSQTRKMLFLK